MTTKPANRWDIFCNVIDNYGDIGVCWRLAQQLATGHDLQVQLWVDDLNPLAKLRPGVVATAEIQVVDDIAIRYWPKVFPEISRVDVADVVVEAFGCELPDIYVDAMNRRDTIPVWINLEYLSAETWVENTHGLPSPHPQHALTKYFFFPGFTDKTGGLIREADYDFRRAKFDEAALRLKLGLSPKCEHELTISLFGYENPALPALLGVWAKSPQPITCIVPESHLLRGVQNFFDTTNTRMQRGNLAIHAIPFLPQDEYDELLWLSDLNFVRGEDSFVRAQWAEKPLVWQIYPQTETTHLIKLNAFLDRYLAGLPSPTAQATRNFWKAWNEDAGLGKTWSTFANALSELDQHGQRWARKIAAPGDLAGNLLRFSRKIACN